jgi:hypothetical protein
VLEFIAFIFPLTRKRNYELTLEKCDTFSGLAIFWFRLEIPFLPIPYILFEAGCDISEIWEMIQHSEIIPNKFRKPIGTRIGHLTLLIIHLSPPQEELVFFLINSSLAFHDPDTHLKGK